MISKHVMVTWFAFQAHYVCVFATFPELKSNGFEFVYLAFSQLENENSQNIGELTDFLSLVLHVFKNLLMTSMTSLVISAAQANPLLQRSKSLC